VSIAGESGRSTGRLGRSVSMVIVGGRLMAAWEMAV